MARKALIEKEKKRAKLVALSYDKRQALKIIIRSLTASDEDKKEAMIKMDKLPKNSSPIRIRNRCHQPADRAATTVNSKYPDFASVKWP